MIGRRAVSALVLAGGRSRRFGGDKLGARWHGRTLLDHTLDAVASLSDDVIVLRGRARPPDVADAGRRRVRTLYDTADSPGPLVAVAAGLAECRHRLVLLIAADMPAAGRDALALLVEQACDTRAPVTAFELNGAAQPLPLALRRPEAAAIARALVDAGDRRLRGLVEHVDVQLLPERAWRAVDPNGAVLRDVDTQADLEALQQLSA